MPADDRIVAVALLTSEELRALGPAFTRAWPIDETPCFDELLHAIDVADREMCLTRDDDPKG